VFWRGDVSALGAPASAAIVGTRRCTGYGVDVARQRGRDLAAAGVAGGSGLALGLDGAAHEGALAGAATAAGARPIGVVGSGLDVVYPGRHRTLWRRMGEDGLLLSESPLGSAPEPWRFPMRNRLIAALSDVVVVVESHAAGGSMSTVRAADERNVPVMAVPGSVRSSSSEGTNRLLADGIPPVVDAEDVLVALSLQGRFVSGRTRVDGTDPQVEVEGSLDEPATRVLAAVDWTPTSTEEVLRRTQLPVADATVALTRLESAGLVRRRSGGWWERRAAGEPRGR
jgi:DNA processing protein